MHSGDEKCDEVPREAWLSINRDPYDMAYGFLEEMIWWAKHRFEDVPRKIKDVKENSKIYREKKGGQRGCWENLWGCERQGHERFEDLSRGGVNHSEVDEAHNNTAVGRSTSTYLS